MIQFLNRRALWVILLCLTTLQGFAASGIQSSEKQPLNVVTKGTDRNFELAVTMMLSPDPDVLSGVGDAHDHKVVSAERDTTLFIVGLATEAGSNSPGDAIPMRRLKDDNGLGTGRYEIYTFLREEGGFRFVTARDSSGTPIAGDADGSLRKESRALCSVSDEGFNRVVADLNTMTYSITPVKDVNIVSHLLPKGPGEATHWGGVHPLGTYEGRGVWLDVVNFTVPTRADDNPRFYIEIEGVQKVLKYKKGTANTLAYDREGDDSLKDIDQFPGAYTVRVDLQNFTFDIHKKCPAVDTLKIAVMGSSVAKGYGASVAKDDSTQYMGYAHRYDLLLQDRAGKGIGNHWTFSNISIGGNTTVHLLDRFDRHLMTDCSTYVVYGLSLANEGIMWKGQEAFDQFRENMIVLIERARAQGKEPVVMGNYANGYYNESHYQFIKDMNMLIHQWDVPSVNVLGALDDGTGKWVEGYSKDPGHPNDKGYTEMMLAMVPSLFDALEAKKPQPVWMEDTWVRLGKRVKKRLSVVPEGQVHSFTTSVDFRTDGEGTLLKLQTETGEGKVALAGAAGQIVYTSPGSETVRGKVTANDADWHTLTLTHYYARGETIVYLDGRSLGSVKERLLLHRLTINDKGTAKIIDYRNWLFYRSGMHSDEVGAMASGTLLRSSLELYAPLDGQARSEAWKYINLARSMNTIILE